MSTTKTYAYVGLGALGVGAALYGGIRLTKYLKGRSALKETKQYEKKTYSGNGIQKINLYEVADAVANGLGINKGWYNPQSWTENDTDVYNAIKVVPSPLINELATIYASKYKRNLRSDLNEFLDAPLYAKIKNLLY